MGQTTVRYFKEIPAQTSTITAFFVSLEESIAIITSNVLPINGQGSDSPEKLTYFCVVPDEVLAKPAGYQWAVTFELSSSVTLSTDIFTVPGEHSLLQEKLDDLETRLKIMEIKNDFMRSAIDGKAVTSTDGQTVKVYDKDNVIIQRLKIVNGIRTPEMTDVFFEIVDGEYEVSTEAILVDGVWVTELAQYSEVECGSNE
jgi:hypothetical protein